LCNAVDDDGVLSMIIIFLILLIFVYISFSYYNYLIVMLERYFLLIIIFAVLIIITVIYMFSSFFSFIRLLVRGAMTFYHFAHFSFSLHEKTWNVNNVSGQKSRLFQCKRFIENRGEVVL
jgi:hypothetical protein